MKEYQEWLQESYKEEHAEAVKNAEKSFTNWQNLIIWDLLEIQEIASSLREALDTKKKLKVFIETLREDIDILKDQTIGSSRIFYVQQSNLNMIKIAGYAQQTLEILDDEDRDLLLRVIDELKLAIKVYNEKKGTNYIYTFIEATKRWNKIPSNKKEQYLHNWEVRISKIIDDDINGDYLKDI